MYHKTMIARFSYYGKLNTIISKVLHILHYEFRSGNLLFLLRSRKIGMLHTKVFECADSIFGYRKGLRQIFKALEPSCFHHLAVSSRRCR